MFLILFLGFNYFLIFLFLILLSIGSNDVRQRKSGNENSANKEEEEGTKQIQFDIEEIKQIKTDFQKESSFQKAVQFSRDHSILATGGSDGYLRVWKVASSWFLAHPRHSDKVWGAYAIPSASGPCKRFWSRSYI